MTTKHRWTKGEHDSRISLRTNHDIMSHKRTSVWILKDDGGYTLRISVGWDVEASVTEWYRTQGDAKKVGEKIIDEMNQLEGDTWTTQDARWYVINNFHRWHMAAVWGD